MPVDTDPVVEGFVKVCRNCGRLVERQEVDGTRHYRMACSCEAGAVYIRAELLKNSHELEGRFWPERVG